MWKLNNRDYSYKSWHLDSTKMQVFIVKKIRAKLISIQSKVYVKCTPLHHLYYPISKPAHWKDNLKEIKNPIKKLGLFSNYIYQSKRHKSCSMLEAKRGARWVSSNSDCVLSGNWSELRLEQKLIGIFNNQLQTFWIRRKW